MSVIIETKNGEMVFENNNTIRVGTQPDCDVLINVSCNFVLSIEPTEQGLKVKNIFSSPQILFKGQPMTDELNIEKICKLMIEGTDEFVGIRKQTPLYHQPQIKQQPTVTMSDIASKDFDENDIRELYGENVNAATKIKLEKRKSDIEKRRVTVLKEISYFLEDSRKKIAANSMAERFLLVALIFCPVIMASALSETLQSIVIPSLTKSFFPLYMRFLAGYAILLFVNSLLLKQGVFLVLQDKINKNNCQPSSGTIAKGFMLGLSAVIFIGICAFLIFAFANSNITSGSLVVSILAMLALILCAVSGGYFKSVMNEALIQYDKYENREDFKKVMHDYGQWIGFYINNLSSVKLKNLKDKLFNLKLKATGEVVLGILTAPFLAYGVSNTLAMCFPEAAGWVRISGLRISPVFLVLATFMIIFAFFALTSSFVLTKRVNGAEVIKKDGFNNYMQHGIDLFGTEAVKKLKSESFKAFLIAISIIIIEFTMNVSYFMQEIGGGEWSGIILSIIAALVPTALLVAETFMLSHTKYEIHTCDELFARLDKEII